MKASFDFFVAVDWSGAKGLTQKGIQVAVCRKGDSPPELISPTNSKHWSRLAVINWLNEFARKKSFLVGIDFSFATPFVDEGAYFPGTSICPKDAFSLWKEIEEICAKDPNLYGRSFIEHEAVAPFFLDGEKRGLKHKRRFRVTEIRCIEAGFGNAETFFHLVGASQVGKGSVSGMRALQKFKNFTIWPFEEIKKNQSVIVEIYTPVLLTLGGFETKKINSLQVLNNALLTLNTKPIERLDRLDNNITDALVSAAGLRRFAGLKALWMPSDLTEEVRKTEGWTFGVI